jgi:pimeloyl-ACP methyl ester carboxylesterase
MVFSETFAELVEVRRGRRLFVREIFIGTDPSSSSIGKIPDLQLVCVHGTCGTERQFHLLLEKLDELIINTGIQIKCLLYDKLGCGKSQIIDDWNAYSNEEDKKDLDALLQMKLDPLLDQVIIGHSYALSAPILPLLRDNILKKLVGCILIGTAVRSEHLKIQDGGHPIMALPIFLLQCLQKQLTNSFVHMAVHPDHVAIMDAIRNESNSNNMMVAKAYHRKMKWATPKELLPIRDIPVLIMHGTADGIVPVECAQFLSNCFSASQLVVIERASHLVMIEQPQLSADAVWKFLHTVREF